MQIVHLKHPDRELTLGDTALCLGNFDGVHRGHRALIDELKKKNDNLLKKYNGDAKFARVHKRIKEENQARSNRKPPETPIIATGDLDIYNTLLRIKTTIDDQVYDRNDILKKDAYFEQTVMSLISQGMKELNSSSPRSDRTFIQSRIATQYLQQYHHKYRGKG